MKNHLLLIKDSCFLIMAFWSSLAFSQPVIRVAGSKEAQIVKQQALFFLDHLDVQENFYLTIIFSAKLPKKLKGYTVSDPSLEPDKYQNIRVIIDARLEIEKQMLVLAHEMIHVKQYAKKELKVFYDKRVLWRGRIYHASSGSNRNMPWEKEAYHDDFSLVELLKSSQDHFQEFLAERAPKDTSDTLCKSSYWTRKCSGENSICLLVKDSPKIFPTKYQNFGQ